MSIIIGRCIGVLIMSVYWLAYALTVGVIMAGLSAASPFVWLFRASRRISTAIKKARR
jgi:hypothetical protein